MNGFAVSVFAASPPPPIAAVIRVSPSIGSLSNRLPSQSHTPSTSHSSGSPSPSESELLTPDIEKLSNWRSPWTSQMPVLCLHGLARHNAPCPLLSYSNQWRGWMDFNVTSRAFWIRNRFSRTAIFILLTAKFRWWRRQSLRKYQIPGYAEIRSTSFCFYKFAFSSNNIANNRLATLWHTTGFYGLKFIGVWYVVEFLSTRISVERLCWEDELSIM
jgi:hypothetical protein